jgi:hypothetical protein
MISIITEITRRKLFRYASNDCVCEFISEPWEWLHEASSRVSDRIYTWNLSPAHRACFPPPRLIIVFSILRQIFEEKNCSAPSCLKNSRSVPGISFQICWLIIYNVFFYSWQRVMIFDFRLTRMSLWGNPL